MIEMLDRLKLIGDALLFRMPANPPSSAPLPGVAPLPTGETASRKGQIKLLRNVAHPLSVGEGSKKTQPPLQERY